MRYDIASMRKIILVLLALFNAPLAIAGDFTAAKYAGEFISTGVGARALGMGGAYVAVARDVTAGYWNPAGLIGLDYPQIILMHSERFAGIVNYDYAALAGPFDGDKSLGISLIRLGVDGIPITALTNPKLKLGERYRDENGQWRQNRPYVVGTVSDVEYGVFLSYSRALDRKLAYGGNLKILYKGVGDHSAWGIGFDVAAQYALTKNFLLGVNLQDLTSTLLAWDTGRRELITPTIKIGAAYLPPPPVLLAVDVDIRFENRRSTAQYNLGPMSFDFHLGMEYRFQDKIMIRIGSAPILSDFPGQRPPLKAFLGTFTAGAGIKLPRLNIDYAFLGNKDLGNTHRVSLSLTLEEEKFKR